MHSVFSGKVGLMCSKGK